MGNPAIRPSVQASAALSGSEPATALSHGLAIEYRAFARTFSKGDNGAVLFLLASCYYLTSGFTIFFEENGEKYQLMEQPPTAVFTKSGHLLRRLLANGRRVVRSG